MVYELHWANRYTEITQLVGGVFYIIAVYGSVRHRERHDKRNKDSDCRHCCSVGGRFVFSRCNTDCDLLDMLLQVLWPFYII